MTKIKICGMRRVDDILYVNTYHPDYAGFILSEGFKRTVDIDTFYDLELLLNKEIKRVGVFVNEPIENILKSFAQKLDVIQLHGEENAEYISKLRKNCDCEIWKAVRVKYADDIICSAMEKVQPYGVDFSSSVETDGFKDEDKIKRIVETIRNNTERRI